MSPSKSTIVIPNHLGFIVHAMQGNRNMPTTLSSKLILSAITGMNASDA